MCVDVVDPFRCHHRPSVLSSRASVVLSCMSYHLAMHVLCNTLPASSRSLLVTCPAGFLQDTSDSETSSGNGAHQTMGCAPVGLGVSFVAPGMLLMCPGHCGGSREDCSPTYVT